MVEMKKTNIEKESLTIKSLKEFDKSVERKYRTPDGYTCDIVVFAVSKQKQQKKPEFKVMLIQRKEFEKDGSLNIEGGKWALPGGFVEYGECGYEAVQRELKEETNIEGLKATHLGVYDKPGRDKRGWIISNAHYTIVNEEELKARKAGDDAKEVRLFTVDEAAKLNLAFDHREIIKDALKAVKRQKVSVYLKRVYKVV